MTKSVYSAGRVAKHIVDKLIGPAHWYEDIAGPILEMPQHFPGQVVYQRATKFLPITARNFATYIRLGSDGHFTFTVTPQLNAGYAFANSDIEAGERSGMAPVLQLELRDSGIKGYKQAFRLRIREDFARRAVATTWYALYAQAYGGIVSDFEHLEGGMQLWRSFVDTAQRRGLKVSLVDTTTGVWTPVGADTPDEAIWSTDSSRRAQVLVLEK